jgi:hypothetical protein
MSNGGTRWNKILNCMIENVFDLKFVLVILMACAEHAELIGKIQAFAEVFRRYKVKCNLNAIVNVNDLMWSTGGDENGVAFVLNDCVTVDSFVLEAFSEFIVNEPILRKLKV